MVIFILILGLVVGSFLGALTWRYPRGTSVLKGRSVCNYCMERLTWYDNIPLLSFLLLKGRSRCCGKRMSVREPLIEVATGFSFVIVYLGMDRMLTNIGWARGLGIFTLPLFLFVAALLIAAFVIDFEFQILPDGVFVIGLVTTLMALVITHSPVYFYFLAGLSSGLFLLFLHAVTMGRGMGLGDVKLAVFMGTFLGVKLAVFWMFVSFFWGGLFGIIVLLLGLRKLGEKIAFGPFLVLGFLTVIVFGMEISKIILI